MKKTILALAAVSILTTACTNNSIDTANAEKAQITFRVNGDFSLSTMPMTRALEADGKAMTDLWILDYIGTTLQHQIHQTSSDEDFGTPTLNLAVGSHHIYFIASRSQSPTLSTAEHTLTFGKVFDTFWLEYPINVTASSNGSRSVTLDRVVTKLTTTITDAIPTGASTFNIIPSTWYYGINYMTGEPTSAATNQTITISIPASEIGNTNERLNVYGFSGSMEWTTDVSLNCKTSGGEILGSAVVTDAPLVRNRVTNYSGPLFSTEGLTTVSLSSTWADPINDTW